MFSMVIFIDHMQEMAYRTTFSPQKSIEHQTQVLLKGQVGSNLCPDLPTPQHCRVTSGPGTFSQKSVVSG